MVDLWRDTTVWAARMLAFVSEGTSPSGSDAADEGSNLLVRGVAFILVLSVLAALGLGVNRTRHRWRARKPNRTGPAD